jgi:hypothetical protein
MLTIKDARGRESKTLGFVLVSWLAVTGKFVAAGMDLSTFGMGATSQISLTEYAAAVAAILAIWLGREWVDTKR